MSSPSRTTGRVISTIFAVVFTGLLMTPHVGGIQLDRWLPPLNNIEMLGLLCTETMHKHVIAEVQQMRDAQARAVAENDPMRSIPRAPIISILWHNILCRRNFTERYNGRKYEGIIWFMRSLDFCEIKHIILKNPGLRYTRDFQVDMLRAGFALVCHKTDDIGKYQLSPYADLFRIIYERHNVNRPIICSRLMDMHRNLYNRCHVDSTLANLTIAMTRCQGEKASPLIKLRGFFSRFSRQCQTLPEFYHGGDRFDHHLGEALANDSVYMNMLSSHIKRTVMSYSMLPHLVLKTRLLLQHFPLAAIRMHDIIEAGEMCKNTESEHIDLESADSKGGSESNETTTDTNVEEECKLLDEIGPETAQEFIRLGRLSFAGVCIEVALLGIVIFNSTVLSIFLHQTKAKLSTATILFVFNILFSNALFVASFACMFSDYYDDLPHGFNEEQFHERSAALIIAETLQTHLFAPSEFFKHLVQETLFSLAQNGSLLGLTHLLVLVLLVINKSMSGKAIRLSRRSVILVFAFVWVFLIVTHVIFSALQFSAITNLDHLFSELNSNPGSLNCSMPMTSDYTIISNRCDKVALFHTWGVYLLRGHTLFTLTFLVTSIIVFLLTLLYHWKVRSQHDFLGNNMRDQNPHSRRETLFNTLLLSIGAFFMSVLFQSFIEIAVFWVDDRQGVAELASYYQFARILSFTDPVFNPILVAVRTPSIRRRLRYYLCLTSGIMASIFWPVKLVRQRRQNSRDERRKRHTPQRRASSTTDSVSHHRQGSVDSQVTLKILCTRHHVRTSLLRRSKASSHNDSLV